MSLITGKQLYPITTRRAVLPLFPTPAWHGRVMAQRKTHKGDRAQIMARPDRIVYDIVKAKAAELGIPMGQYVADVLAEHTGHPDLVRELNKEREVLPLAM